MPDQNSKEGITLTLNPNANPSEETPIPQMGAVASEEEKKDFSAGTIDESMLTDEEKETVAKFVNEIDITNVEQMTQYGVSAQRNITDFSVSVLRKVKTMDLGEIGETLKELTVTLDATTEAEKKGLAGLFQKAKHGVNSIRANYAKAEDNVDKLEKDLQKHLQVLNKDIAMYQDMYELNNRYYKELTMYIIAGKKALDQAKTGKLQELKNKADQTQKQEDAMEYKDFLDQCNRFDKKLSTLEVSRMVAIETAPQVRLLQNNDREMVDQIQSSLSSAIPLWRNQLVLSLGIEHTRRAVDAQTALADKTNELLKKNAETLKMASIDAARESERPLVEIDTLRQCNRDLITSINEVMKIHEQGEQKRQQVHDELVKIEEELKETLLEVRA